MKQLLIIGASGLGRTIYEMAQNAKGYGEEFEIKGFLDIDLHAMDAYPYYLPVINNEDDYEIQPDDVFICAIGDVTLKKRITEKMVARGAKFHKVIHKTANVSPTAKIGDGCVVGTGAIIGPSETIGAHTLIQSYAILGHDGSVGAYSRIDCRVMCVGGVKIGNEVTLHTACVINHDVTVQDKATVAACSFVIRNVKEGTTVMGNPAKRLKFE